MQFNNLEVGSSHAIEIKRWHIEGKDITVINKNDTLYFTPKQKGINTTIPARDVIGIPANLPLSALSAFLVETWVRVSKVGEQSYKLYIQPRLNGGANIIGDDEYEYLWPQGIVPYEIDSRKYPVGEEGRKIILNAIREWNAADTGFQFVARTNQRDVLVFGEDPEACYSNVGRQSGVQYIRCHLHGGQFDEASIMHEIGHAIGFYHEQQRSDRNEYVQITKKDRRGNTMPLAKDDQADFAVEGNTFGRYDFYSIMHYPINEELSGNVTITPRVSVRRSQEVGVTPTLSAGDIKAARHLSKLSKQLPLPSQGVEIASIRAAAHSAVRARTPEYITIREKGDLAFSRKNYTTALSYYRALIKEYGSELKPDLLAALYNRCGICHSHLRQYQHARICYANALEIEPKNSIFRKNYHHVLQEAGDFYFEDKEYDNAFECYRLLIEEFNELLPQASLAELNNCCGICCVRLGKKDAARGWYQAALAIEPNNPIIKRNYQQLMN